MFDPRMNLIHALFARTFTALDDNLRDPTQHDPLVVQHHLRDRTGKR